MKEAEWKFVIAAWAILATSLAACKNQDGLNATELPRRFSYELYQDCQAIKRAWKPDYISLARSRFAKGQNVFLYRGPPSGSAPPLYSGLHDAEWHLTAAARAAIAKGGSWGVSYPDTGCPNISPDIDEHYMEQYNRFALSLYTPK